MITLTFETPHGTKYAQRRRRLAVSPPLVAILLALSIAPVPPRRASADSQERAPELRSVRALATEDLSAPEVSELYRWYRVQGFEAWPGDGLCGGSPAFDLAAPDGPFCGQCLPDFLARRPKPVFASCGTKPSYPTSPRDAFTVLRAWIQTTSPWLLAAELDDVAAVVSGFATGRCAVARAGVPLGDGHTAHRDYLRFLAAQGREAQGPTAIAAWLALSEQLKQARPTPWTRTLQRFSAAEGKPWPEPILDFGDFRAELLRRAHFGEAPLPGFCPRPTQGRVPQGEISEVPVADAKTAGHPLRFWMQRALTQPVSAIHPTGIGPGDSAFALLSIGLASQIEELRLWLEGDRYTYWAMSAAILGKNGLLLRTLRSPVLDQKRLYLPLHVGDAAHVLVTVTRVEPNPDHLQGTGVPQRSFRLSAALY